MDIWKELQEKWPWLAVAAGAGASLLIALHYLTDQQNKKTAEEHAHNCQSHETCGLSVVIPTKNEERVIGELMQCLKGQESAGVPVEIIVVDGFSEDRTPQIARELGADIVYQDHGKVSRARNIGALLSKYPHLLILDADTLLKGKDFLKKLVKHVHEHHVRFGTFYMEAKSDWLIGVLYWFMNIYNHWNPSGCGAYWYVDRDVFFEMKGFDEKIMFCEDVGLTRRIVRKYPCRMIPATVYWDERRIKREGVLSLCSRYLAALWTKSADAEELNAIDPGYFERSAGGRYYLSDKAVVIDEQRQEGAN